jgi:hypothetical protein
VLFLHSGKRGAAVVQAGGDCYVEAVASATAHAGVANESSMVCWRRPRAHCSGDRESAMYCLAGGGVVHPTSGGHRAPGCRRLQTGDQLCRERLQHIATVPWWPCRAVLAHVARGIGTGCSGSDDNDGDNTRCRGIVAVPPVPVVTWCCGPNFIPVVPNLVNDKLLPQLLLLYKNYLRNFLLFLKSY